ncbi:Retrovirus-related Pol polyprotein like [Argiope bruennichi]|uniref:Retrovirus-related Pol polyprotein like n=1 Tax=Argiope bruennichi TaxID=94029 RepID=A0A8T0FKQ7_ARGBR|nr:Retrovirus-related Pol polyprotein like [Argiope bruennichi]
MADSGNGDLLALLAKMKKSIEAGQERMEEMKDGLEKEMRSGRERMEEMEAGLEKEIRSGQERMEQSLRRASQGKANGWNPQAKAFHLAASLKGDTARHPWTLTEEQRQCFSKLYRVALELGFGEKCTKEYSRLQLKSRYQKSGESLQELAADIQRLSHLAFSDCPVETRQDLALQHFIDKAEQQATRKDRHPIRAVTAADSDFDFVKQIEDLRREIWRLKERKGGRSTEIRCWTCGTAGKCLSKRERNYCVTRKELLAIVKAIESFHPYLYGRRFLLRTDHASLTWLLNFKKPEVQIARWIQRQQEYGMEIRHRKGSAHGNADALSRRPCSENCNYCSRVEKKFGMVEPVVRQVTTPSTSESDPWGDESVRKNQLADPEIKPIIEFKESIGGKPSWQDIAPFHPTSWETH